ncbi:MAG TPA: LysM peptidoglycan-binding domain-containing protein [Pedobacter sp.]|jgi:LysM repeat protein
MRFFLSVFCFLLSLGAIASTPIDSVGVENQNGNQVILHKVERKETYYSIARLYNVPPKTIISQNNNVALQIGLVIKVPTLRSYHPATNPAKTTNPPAQNAEVIQYKVGPKEYLYSIARRFNTSVEELRKLNNLRSDNLSIGQIIKVPQGQTQTVPAVIATAPTETTLPPTEPEKVKIPTSRLGLSERTERGVAVWIADENLDGSKMLALHRTAPVGTVIKITNPMTERSTFVKVVGKFTENESTKDVIIVITKASADLLGVLDKRFQSTIDYGVPQSE